MENHPIQFVDIDRSGVTVGTYRSGNAVYIDVNSQLTQRTLEVFNNSLFPHPHCSSVQYICWRRRLTTLNVFLIVHEYFWAAVSPGSVPKRLPFLYLDYYSHLFNLALLKAGTCTINPEAGVKTEISSSYKRNKMQC